MFITLKDINTCLKELPFLQRNYSYSKIATIMLGCLAIGGILGAAGFFHLGPIPFIAEMVGTSATVLGSGTSLITMLYFRARIQNNQETIQKTKPMSFFEDNFENPDFIDYLRSENEEVFLSFIEFANNHSHIPKFEGTAKILAQFPEKLGQHFSKLSLTLAKRIYSKMEENEKMKKSQKKDFLFSAISTFLKEKQTSDVLAILYIDSEILFQNVANELNVNLFNLMESIKENVKNVKIKQ